MSGQRHAPVALYPRGKKTDTHWPGGWVGPRASLDTEVTEKKSFNSAGDRTWMARSSSP
jgi:hypothetical protein